MRTLLVAAAAAVVPFVVIVIPLSPPDMRWISLCKQVGSFRSRVKPKGKLAQSSKQPPPHIQAWPPHHPWRWCLPTVAMASRRGKQVDSSLHELNLRSSALCGALLCRTQWTTIICILFPFERQVPFGSHCCLLMPHEVVGSCENTALQVCLPKADSEIRIFGASLAHMSKRQTPFVSPSQPVRACSSSAICELNLSCRFSRLFSTLSRAHSSTPQSHVSGQSSGDELCAGSERLSGRSQLNWINQTRPGRQRAQRAVSNRNCAHILLLDGARFAVCALAPNSSTAS